MASESIVGALRVVLGMDTAEFEQGADSAERRTKRLQKSWKSLGDGMLGLGKKLTIGLTAPLVAFGGLSAKTASDAAELQSSFNQTFGKMSGDMNRWAETTGDAMGRSTQELQRAANTFGIFFNQAAPTKKVAADMSKSFSVLAQDLASFYNVSEGEALQKLRSGLAGESEPLRDFGVFLSEAAVKAKALEMGLGGLSGELTEQEKIMARAALIMEKTKNAQGDVARTADGTANQMRRAKAAFEELQVAVGTKLLPALTPLIEKLGSLLDWFAKLPDGVQTFIVGLAAISAAVGPALIGLGGLAKGIGALLPVMKMLGPVIGLVSKALLGLLANPIVLGAAVVIGGIYLAWKNWDKIKPIIDAVIAAVIEFWSVHVKPIFDKLGALLVGAVKWWWDLQIGVAKAVAALFGAVKDWLADKLGAVWDFLKGAVTAYFSLWTSLPLKAVAAARALYDGVKTWIKDRLSAIWDFAAGKIEWLESKFGWLFDRVVGNSWIPDLVNGVGHHIGRLDQVMVKPALAAIAAVDGAFASMTGPRIPGITDVEGGLGVPGAIEAIGGLAEAGEDAANKTEIQTVRIAESFKDMTTNTMEALRGLVDAIKGGDFFSILEGVVGLVLQLGGSGLFGKGFQARVNGSPGTGGYGGSVPGFANGGSFRFGGVPGVDRNLLSLNGTPIARVSKGETAHIAPANARSEPAIVRVLVGANDYFDAKVAQVSGSVVARATPAIVGVSSARAVGRIGKLRERSLVAY